MVETLRSLGDECIVMSAAARLHTQFSGVVRDCLNLSTSAKRRVPEKTQKQRKVEIALSREL